MITDIRFQRHLQYLEIKDFVHEMPRWKNKQKQFTTEYAIETCFVSKF